MTRGVGQGQKESEDGPVNNSWEGEMALTSLEGAWKTAGNVLYPGLSEQFYHEGSVNYSGVFRSKLCLEASC